MINIISLIDILVVLLIFYIVTTVFKKPEPKVVIKVPDSTQAKPTQDSAPSIIYVTADRQVFLDDKPVDITMLGDALQEKMLGNPSFKVALKADTDAPFGLITKVLDAAKKAGLADLPTFMNPNQNGNAAPANPGP